MNTENLSLPFIMPSQAQKHVTHNEALQTLDALVQLAVASRALGAPPAGFEPAEGQRYIVAEPAAGDWAGREGEIAARQGGAWRFLSPRSGWLALVLDEAALVHFDGAGWSPLASPETLSLARLGVNAQVDETNRLAVAAPASLFNHEGAGHQVKINKNAAGDTASLLFQTGFSGRAEMGTAGNDDFCVKVSADGAAWKEALVIDAASGDLSLPAARLGIGTQTPTERLEIVDAMPRLKVSGTRHDASITFSITDEGNLFFQKAAGAANWNFRLNPLDGIGQAQYLFGQSTGSTGPTFITLLNSDNTQQVRLASRSLHSFVCAQGGNFGIGVANPDARLRVAGSIKAEAVLPLADNAHAIGSANLRYATIFAASGPISTSDAALKTDIGDIPQAIVEALRPVAAKLYRSLDAVEEKGREAARWHYGYLAQEVEAALSRLELDGVPADAFRHAFLCRDEVLEEVQTGADADGQPVAEQHSTGRYRYGLRYGEFLALRDEMHRRDIAALDARLSALAARIAGADAA